MNNIHFKLRGQGKSNPIITLHVSDSRFKGRRFRYSTGLTVATELWLKKKERAKVIPIQEMELNSLNDFLDKLFRCVTDFLALKINSKTIVNEDLKSRLNALQVDEQKELQEQQEKELKIEKQKLEQENDFYSTWKRIINTTKNKDGLPLSEGTKRSKRQTLNLIQEHCAKNKIRLTFETLDKTYYHDLDNYMIEKSFSPNIVESILKKLKLF